MTTKEWLKRARNLDIRIKALEESKRRAYDRATAAVRASGRDFTGAAGNMSHNGKMDAYIELSDEVDRQVKELERVRAEILNVIAQVKDNTLATLLTEYYVNGRTWREVAAAIHYNYPYTVKQKHPAALREIERLRKNKP